MGFKGVKTIYACLRDGLSHCVLSLFVPPLFFFGKPCEDCFVVLALPVYFFLYYVLLRTGVLNFNRHGIILLNTYNVIYTTKDLLRRSIW